MTPAERLLKAADLLDKRASVTTRGPWRAVATDGRAIVTSWDGAVLLPGATTDANARYIATMHPEVGKRIAVWLRWEADYEADWALAALDLADLLLAGDS